MICDEIRERLSEYVDGYLTENERESVSKHLGSCPACKQELSRISLVIKAVKHLPVVQAPPDFVYRLRERIEAEQASWWKGTAERFSRALEIMPLRAMTAAATVVLVIMVLVSGSHFKAPNPLKVAKNVVDNTHPAILAANTEPIPIEFVSTHPSETADPVSLDSPNEFLMKIIKNDPAFNQYQVLPHPRGVGALINTPQYLYEVVMDPAEFPVIQTFIEQQGGKIPATLRSARMIYPIYVRALPSPTAPLTPGQ